jgi:tetratricopeptide (TPR) repeat protein
VVGAAICLFLPLSAVAGDRLQEVLEHAGAAWKEGRYQEAEKGYKEAIELEGDASRAHARLAAFYLYRQRPDEAIAEYQEAIIRDPENPRLFVAMAIAYMHKQAYGMAQTMVQRALELDPGLANAQKLKAYVTAKQQAMNAIHGGATAARNVP